MKSVFLAVFIFASLGYASGPAQRLNSLPEFECTLLDIKNAHGAKNFYGLKKHSALSLRSAPEKWYLELAKLSFILKQGDVKKTSNPVAKQTEYVISVSNYRTLSVVLTGVPPSRNGQLKMTNGAQVIFSGRVTCH